jgi:ABC-type antimicrobial peptide transport system permease subunit
MFLLLVYLIYHSLIKLSSNRFVPQFVRVPMLRESKRIVTFLNLWTRQQEKTINRLNLIDLAMRNLRFKKSRSLITVGGMAIGIAIIVFLVSIGFGLQRLVVNRVARLDELKQTDVSVNPGSKDKITDDTIAKIKNQPDVEKVLPMIATVSRVSYQNSISDVAVYAVTADYLESSAVKPIRGTIFESNELAFDLKPGAVAGVSDDRENDITTDHQVSFTLPEGEWFKVRKTPARNGEIIGFTRQVAGTLQGYRVPGDSFAEVLDLIDPPFTQTNQGPWLKTSYPIWQLTKCDETIITCDDGYEIARAPDGGQLYTEGFIAQRFNSVSVDLIKQPGSVLGDAVDEEGNSLFAEAEVATPETEVLAEADTTASEFAAAGDWVEIASESAAANTNVAQHVGLHQGAHRQAVVNIAMLKILGINENDAIGKTFSTSFIVVGDLLLEDQPKIESDAADYTIVGVVPTEDAPYYYVPFVDLRGLGITAYSQLKVVSKQAEDLDKVRKQIESYGYSSRSVADTVKQIDQLFASLRVVLVIVGMVALSIAALGMFNTLTVSLLERTREVGLMKAMGMKSHEVQELFLTESLVMGFFGGLGGIILGWLMGKTLSLVVSLFSLSNGLGIMDVSYLPLNFIVFIFVISMIVGIFTGIYPARRATNISALNALRYE